MNSNKRLYLSLFFVLLFLVTIVSNGSTEAVPHTQIASLDDKLKGQARYRRNQQREDTIREYVDRAIRFKEQGKTKEAKALLKEALELADHEEMQSYVLERVLREGVDESGSDGAAVILAKNVSETYKKGVDLYNQSKFTAAEVYFSKVVEKLPDFSVAKIYAMLIDIELGAEMAEVTEVAEAVEVTEADEAPMPKEDGEQEVVEDEVLAQKRAKEEWRKMIAEKEKAAQLSPTDDKVKMLYKEAVELFNGKQYQAAREKFKEVEWAVPNYRSTVKYLEKIAAISKAEEEKMKTAEKEKQMVEQKEKKEKMAKKKKVAAIYKEALGYYKDDHFESAKELLLEVQQMDPDYKSTRKYLAKIDKKMSDIIKMKTKSESLEKVVAENVNTNETVIDSLYKSAITLYNDKEYDRAKETFEMVREIDPNYKSLERYLQKIDKELLEQDNEDVSAFEEVKESAYIKRLEAQRKEEFLRQAEDKYQDAVSYYNHQLFADAKLKFIEVEAIHPDYKKTLDYLGHIDEDIERYQSKASAEREAQIIAREKAIKEKVAKASDPALKKDKKDVEKAEKMEKVEKRVEKKDMKKEKRMDPVEEIKMTYKKAVRFYRQRKYTEAIDAFNEVDRLSPDYRSTRKYLSKIDKRLEKEELKEQAKQAKLEKEKKMQEEKMAKKEAAKKMAEEKKAEEEMAAKQEDKSKEEMVKKDEDEAEFQLSKQKDKELKVMYVDALKLYKGREFSKAKEAFLKINDMSPDYRSSKKYLARIEARLEKSEKIKSEKFAKMQKAKEAKEADELARKEKEKTREQKEVDNLKMAKKNEHKIAGIEKQRKDNLEHDSLKQMDKAKKYQEMKGRDSEKGKLDWEALGDKNYARAKAYEEQRDKEKKELYQEFKAQLDKEQDAAEKVEQARQKRIEEEKNAVLAQLEAEKAEKERLEKERMLAKEKQLRTEEKKAFEAELAAQRAEELAEKEALRREKELEQQKIKEEKEKEKEAARLARLAEAEKHEVKADKEKDQMDKEVKLVEKEKKEEKKKEKKKKSVKKKLTKEEKIAKKMAKQNAKIRKQQQKDLNRKSKEVKAMLKKLRKEEDRVWSDDIAAMYKEGVTLYKNGNYLAAKRQFLSVEGLRPGYKSARSYIDKIDAAVNVEEHAEDDMVLQEPVIEEYDVAEEKMMKEHEEKRAKEEQLAKQEKKMAHKQKQMDKKKARAEERARKQRERALIKQIDALYIKAADLYRYSDKTLANSTFEDINRLLAHQDISPRYAKKMRTKIVKLKQKIDMREQKNREYEKRKMAKQKVDQEKALMQKEADRLSIEQAAKDDMHLDASQQMQVRDSQKQKELDQLAKQIKHDEKKLFKERTRQEKELAALKEREADIARREIMREQLREKRLARQKDRQQEQNRMDEIKRRRMEETRKGRTKTSGNSSGSATEALTAKMEELRQNRLMDDAAGQIVNQKRVELGDLERLTKKERIALEKQRRSKLRELIHQRQEDIKMERAKVQKEFKEQIESLYQKAVRLTKAGDYASARNIFAEINRMEPGYKKVNHYLKTISKKKSKTRQASWSTSPDVAVVTPSLSQDSHVSQPKPKTRYDVISDALDKVEFGR